jgi:triphosphoribosyl-dephospho-CoA synthase
MTDEARQAFLRACEFDVAVRKPGNVSLVSPGHGMTAAQFLASAQAAAPALFAPGQRVGRRIEAAVAASWAAAGCNTNLGIVLLCAPIAAAAERLPTSALRPGLEGVLADLDRDDAAAAYRAITRAQPGGLGEAQEEDVRQPPSLGLRAAMALAAGRDSVARQYANGYADLFEIALPQLPPGPLSAAGVQRVFLTLASRLPDSHIVRKHGEAVAQTVMSAAQGWLAQAQSGTDLDASPAFAAWDEELKATAINPGTTADLTVATLLLAALRDDPQRGGPTTG